MGEYNPLFFFLDGQIELKRREVQDLASAIATTESLVELKREFSKE